MPHNKEVDGGRALVNVADASVGPFSEAVQQRAVLIVVLRQICIHIVGNGLVLSVLVEDSSADANSVQLESKIPSPGFCTEARLASDVS